MSRPPTGWKSIPPRLTGRRFNNATILGIINGGLSKSSGKLRRRVLYRHTYGPRASDRTDNMCPRHCLPQRITASQPSAFTSLRVTAAVLGLVLALLMSKPSLADEGSASMYLPGAFGSL